jgi:hypothetical protein
MSRPSQIFAAFLVVITVSALPGVHAFALSNEGSGSSQPPASCHHHLPVAPSKAPVSYQCCVNGHHAAVPSATFSLQPLAVELSSSDNRHPFSVAFSDLLSPMISPPSASPPGAAPLRI